MSKVQPAGSVVTIPSGSTTTRGPNTTSFAYWDQTKYFQQKAVKDPSYHGPNWCCYANNNPVSFADVSGKESLLGPVFDLIKNFLKSMGIDIKNLPKCSQIFFAIMESAVHILSFMAFANAGAELALNGMEGFGTGVFSGNPMWAGICGVSVLAGGTMILLAGIASVLELRNLAMEIYTICALEGE